MLQHRRGTPPRACIKGLISLCEFRFRGGPNRRRWGPHHDAHFRRLIRVLDQVSKGSHFGAEPQSCCGTPARKYGKINPVAVLRLDGVRREHRGLRTRPFLTCGTAAGSSCLLNQTEHAPDNGGTGEQQNSVKGHLLRRSAVGGPMDRGPHPRSLVGWGVFDPRVAPVARGLGSHLAGHGLPTIALSSNPRTHARTSGPRAAETASRVTRCGLL